jgi:hypothetical protein
MPGHNCYYSKYSADGSASYCNMNASCIVDDSMTLYAQCKNTCGYITGGALNGNTLSG